MAITDNSPEENNGSDSTRKLTRESAERNGDIHDSPQDEEKMKSETFTIDMPDVSDIPGQENIIVPQMGEFADTTISSDDEEGVGLFDDDDADEDADLVMGSDADVTAEEKTMLQRADEDMSGQDDPRLRQAELDNTDMEGDPLNEGSLATDVSGGDLDTSGVDSDDPMEAIGEEDEENNTYSLGDDSNDNVTEGTP